RAELRRLFEHRFGDLGARADAEEVRAFDGRLQLGTRQRLRMRVDVRVAVGAQGIDRQGVDALEQDELQAVLRNRKAGLRGVHGGLGRGGRVARRAPSPDDSAAQLRALARSGRWFLGFRAAGRRSMKAARYGPEGKIMKMLAAAVL